MDFHTEVKMKIYGMVAREARMPNAFDVSKELGESVGEVQASFKHLSERRLLVLEPGKETHIRMAPPFSGVETPFLVDVGDKSYYANCVWDAFGVAAAFRKDVVIHASDGHTGESLTLTVKDGQPVPSSYVAHFAVPAVHWWDDIIYT